MVNGKKNSQSSEKSNRFQKSKNLMSIVESMKQGKGIQYRECEGLSHIQVKCVIF